MTFESAVLSLHCIVLAGSYPTFKSIPPVGDVGQPLYLTPYLEAGRTQEAQTAAEVSLPGTNLKSYSGFLTVNATYSSNMFFWYFPSEVDPSKAPVVLWLQGGPGGSSLVGLFCENGPFRIRANLTLIQRQHYWSQLFNVLYIDNPVGTGFSFTGSEGGYARDEVSVGRDLYSALSQFFRLFPQLQKNEFYVSGESYAGKFVPAIAHTIHTNNKLANNAMRLQKINLKGIAIGNGFSDPENMVNFCDYMYHIGLIDSSTREAMRLRQNELVQSILQENYTSALKNFKKVLSIFYLQVGGCVANCRGVSLYNYLRHSQARKCQDIDRYVQSDEIRKRIHVGNLICSNGDLVREYLMQDYFKSVRPWVEELLEHYRVMFYSGQLDVMVAYPQTVNFLQKLAWSGAEAYKRAPRVQWMVGGKLAGYSKTAGRLTEVLVRNAGHMVPQDQPKWALDLITRFVHNRFH